MFSEFAWSARCECYNYHNSSSGRCTCRSTNVEGKYVSGVTDPTRKKGEVAICEECRNNCPAGKGNYVQCLS